MKLNTYSYLGILIINSILSCNYMQVQAATDNCNEWITNSFYSLEGLQNPTENIRSFTDGSTIYWNTCNNYVSSYEDQAKLFFLLKKSDGSFVELTGDSISSAQQINKEKPNLGFIVNYSESETGVLFSLTLKCSTNSQIVQYDGPPREDSQDKYSMTIETGAGCPELQFSAIWGFLEKYKYIIIPVLIAFGIINCFLGYRCFKITLFTVGFMIAFILSTAIFANFIGAVVSDYINWISLSLSLILGFALGVLFYIFEKAGFFFLGALGGFMLGALMYGAFLHQLFDQEYYVYLMYGILIVIGGLLGLWIREAMTILVTSFIGSYLLVRSASFFIAGGKYFPNEFILSKQIESGQFELPDQFYYFLGAIILLWIVGMLVQCKIKSSRSAKGLEESLL